MPAPPKVTILLADEDALRRDGLSAVLTGMENFDVVGGLPDGEAALAEIRESHPNVAIVDLNLPKLHGIELIRRVRAEDLPTRVIILAGTTDDEIIREVVRAGGDGYLLKNSPSRHLIDAICYVQDGGQYFSPQLRRDGRDRHLLEEPPRQYADGIGGGNSNSADAGQAQEPRSSRARSSRARRGRGAADPQQFRERLREESGEGDLSEHDYEIMSMMADGIRPILDRLEEIDNRVAQMEVGDEPVPSNPRGWLTHELAETLDDKRALSRTTASELESRLPEMIEEAVTKRFNQMAGKLQEEIEETHVRTLETFVKNIQVKLVQRVSALEQDLSKQAEAMHELREYSLRTEDNLSRLISGVDRLAQELPKRLAAAQHENARADQMAAPLATSPDEAPRVLRDPPSPRPLRRKPQNGGRRRRMLLTLVGVIAFLALVAWGVAHVVSSPAAASSAAMPSGGAAAPARRVPLPANADVKTKMQAAQQYSDNKDYGMAEDIYKHIIADDPGNVEALKGLASVLYREDKVDESAAILEKIPRN
jgi:DNA-binding NarL/FixJ family response regulator